MGRDVRFNLLGPFEIVSSEPIAIPRRQGRCLLAVLLLEQGRVVAADRLADLLWDGDPPPAARNALSTHVSRLRSVLDPAKVRIGRQGQGYVLDTDPDRVDALRFQSLLRQARDLSVPARAPVLRSALGLWRGPALADIPEIRERFGAGLEEMRLQALALRIDADLAAGRHGELITELRELVASLPHRERFAVRLMLALYRSGRQTDALAVYDHSRRVLAEEFGLSPGRELRKLHERILRADPGLDLPERIAAGSAAPAARPEPQQLPHDIANFIGREEELTRLDALASAGRGRRAPLIVSIDGAPGTGKTTLAIHWAHRLAQREPGVQLYLNLRGYSPGEPITPATAAEILLRGLGVDSERLPPTAEERSALLRTTLAGHDVLMVLDNARDADQVRPLLPGVGGLVIVTSRNQLRGLSIHDGAHRVTLRRLPSDQAIELLATAIGADRVAAESAAAARLAQLCDHLPLALAIVAEHAHRASTLTEVAEALCDEYARLDALGAGVDDPQSDLRAALSWSYQALGADAAAMFRKLGVFPGVDVGLEAAAALADLPMAQAKVALDQLVAAHLVEQRLPHRYELHDLIRLYAANLATTHATAEERVTAVHRALDWYLHAVVSADQQLLPHRRRDFVAPYEPIRPPLDFADQAAATTWFATEYHNLRMIAEWAAEHGFAGYAWRIAVAMTTYADRTAPVGDGVEFLEVVHRAAESANDLTGSAYTLNSLAALLFSEGDLNRAKSCTEQALDLFRELGHQRGEAMTLGNLGLMYAELKEHDAAREHTTAALKLCEQLDYPRGTVMNLDNLGVMHTAAGRYGEAVQCHLRADAISHLVGDRYLDAINQHHLGRAYAGLGKIALSTKAFRESVNHYQALGNRRWVAIVLTDFASMLNDAGHPHIARRMWETALDTLQELGDQRALEIHAVLSGHTDERVP